MKIVTLCEEGIKRAVAAKWLLQFRPEHQVIAVGVKRLHADTLQMLYDWADLIILLDARYADGIPPEKLLVWDVGPDVFHGGFDPILIQRLKALSAATDPAIWQRA